MSRGTNKHWRHAEEAIERNLAGKTVNCILSPAQLPAVAFSTGRLSCATVRAQIRAAPKKIVMSVQHKQPAVLNFENALQKFGAKRAFDILVKKKVGPELLKFWLRDIAAAPDKYGTRPNNRRRVTQLARNARSLADEIEHAEESPPILFTGSRAELDEMLALRIDLLPDRLRGYASYWERLAALEDRMSKKRPRGPQSPKTDRIAALLEIVKELTGAYHYREVADLINVMDKAFGKGKPGFEWTEVQLAQLQSRARDRMAKIQAR